MNDGIKNELDMILLFFYHDGCHNTSSTWIFFSLCYGYTHNPKALSIQGILNIPLSLQGLKVSPKIQGCTLKASPRIQGFYSHLIYYKGSRFSKDSRSLLLLFDSIQGLKATPRIQGLLSRALQGYKVILLSRINSNKTLALLYSLLFHSRSIVPSFYYPRLVSPFGLLPSSTIKTPILFSLSL